MPYDLGHMPLLYFYFHRFICLSPGACLVINSFRGIEKLIGILTSALTKQCISIVLKIDPNWQILLI